MLLFSKEFEVQNILNMGEKVIVCYLLLIVEYPLAFKMLSLLRRLQHLKNCILESYIFLIKYLKHMLLYISGSELFLKKTPFRVNSLGVRVWPCPTN